MHMPRAESSITTSILRTLNNESGVHAVKIHASGEQGRGIPDVLGVAWGRSLAIEVKRPGDKGATAIQKHELEQWRKAGAIATVIRTVDEAKQLLRILQPIGGVK